MIEYINWFLNFVLPYLRIKNVSPGTFKFKIEENNIWTWKKESVVTPVSITEAQLRAPSQTSQFHIAVLFGGFQGIL